MSLESLEGTLLPNVATSAYTVPLNIKVNRFWISFRSNDSLKRTATLHLVPSGGSVAVTNKVLQKDIGWGENFDLDWSQVLHAGDSIHWFGDVTDKIVASLDYQEVPAAGLQVDGKDHTWDSNNAGYIPTTITQIQSVVQAQSYSVPNGKQIKRISIVIHNTGAAAQGFGLFAVPTGATQNIKHLAAAAGGPFVIGPNATREFVATRFLTTGGKIHWHAASANVLVGRVSIEEFAP